VEGEKRREKGRNREGVKISDSGERERVIKSEKSLEKE